MAEVCHSRRRFAEGLEPSSPIDPRDPMPGAFDAHAHLDRLDEPALARCLRRARTAGVTGFALAGADPADWERLVTIATAHGGVWQLGLHPWWAQDLDDGAQDAHLRRLERMLGPHGLGETGLDGMRARSSTQRARQERAFTRQVAIARSRDLPLVLHGTRAWGRVLDGLLAGSRGVLHGFTGSPEVALRAVRMGLHISIGRAALRSPRTQAAITCIPGDRLLLESDAPDGGEPADVVALAAFVAEHRGEDAAERIAESSYNARRLFGA